MASALQSVTADIHTLLGGALQYIAAVHVADAAETHRSVPKFLGLVRKLPCRLPAIHQPEAIGS